MAKMVKITPPVRSFFAQFRTKASGLVSTSRFQRWDDVTRLMENGGYTAFQIIPSTRYPELFYHCGNDLTGINCLCPICRKLLTVEDAKATEPVPNIRYEKVP